MEESKKPWESKTVWLNFVGGMIGALVLFFPHVQMIQEWITGNLPIISMVWGVLGIIIRAVTKGAITLQE